MREFLTSRRARITPDQAGLRTYGDNRRVPGPPGGGRAPRRGSSLLHPPRTRQRDRVSDSVLAALARALQLDEAERAHLFDLARAGRSTTRAARRPAKQRVRPNVQRLLDAITGAPAFLRNGRLDILAANQLGYALYSELYVGPHRPANTARFVFLDPERAAGFFADWGEAADNAVPILRFEAGRDPYDRGLSDLVGELSMQSEAFRTRWAAHNVRLHDTGVKHIHHPVVGDLSLTYERMELVADEGLTMYAYTAEPGSRSDEALDLLASWTATPDQAEAAHATDEA